MTLVESVDLRPMRLETKPSADSTVPSGSLATADQALPAIPKDQEGRSLPSALRVEILKFVGHVGNLLLPLEEQRLSFFWEIYVGKLGHESSQVTHVSPVGGLMPSSKVEELVNGHRVQI